MFTYSKNDPFQHVVFFVLIIYLFLAALGFHCFARAFSSCSEQGLLFTEVRRLLNAVISLVERGSRHTGFGSCSTWAQ